MYLVVRNIVRSGVLYQGSHIRVVLYMTLDILLPTDTYSGTVSDAYSDT